jgi:hypothetical protein
VEIADTGRVVTAPLRELFCRRRQSRPVLLAFAGFSLAGD